MKSPIPDRSRVGDVFQIQCHICGASFSALSSYLFPFLKVSFLTFVKQIMAFQAKLPTQCNFKVKQYT